MRDMQLRFHQGIGTPPRARQLWRRSWLRRHRTGVMLGLSAGIALAAVRIATLPPAVPVYVDRAGYHVGDRLLTRQDHGVFVGDAAVAIVPDGGLVWAGASTMYHGVHTTGHCVMTGSTEVCVFSMGTVLLSAEDHLVQEWGHAVWERAYADGSSVRIPIPTGAAVPVPFPLGR